MSVCSVWLSILSLGLDQLACLEVVWPPTRLRLLGPLRSALLASPFWVREKVGKGYLNAAPLGSSGHLITPEFLIAPRRWSCGQRSAPSPRRKYSMSGGLPSTILREKGVSLRALSQASPVTGVLFSIIMQNPLVRVVCFKLGNGVASQWQEWPKPASCFDFVFNWWMVQHVFMVVCC